MRRRPVVLIRSLARLGQSPAPGWIGRRRCITAEQRIRHLVLTAFLALAAIPLVHQIAIQPSIAQSQPWPAYSSSAPSQRALHGWPAFSGPMARAPVQPPPAAYAGSPVTYVPIFPVWHDYAPAWGYAPIPPQPHPYASAGAPTWSHYGIVATPYPPTAQYWPAYPMPSPYDPGYPRGYPHQPPGGYGSSRELYRPQRPAPQRVYQLSAEDQRVVDELDRRLSRVKGILSESREFDTEAATILFLHEVAEALEYMPQIHAEMRAMNNELRRMNYMMTALPVLAWDLHQVNQKVGLMAWDVNRTMGRMGSMMSWMPF